MADAYKALKDNGVMYGSFKYGDFEGIMDDRYFTYLTEETFTNIINQTKFKIDKIWINEDKLNRDVKWLNVMKKNNFIKKKICGTPKKLNQQFRGSLQLTSFLIYKN